MRLLYIFATAAALVAPPQRTRAPRTVTYGLRDRLSGAFPKTTRVAKRLGDKFRRNRAEDDAAAAEAAAAAWRARRVRPCGQKKNHIVSISRKRGWLTIQM